MLSEFWYDTGSGEVLGGRDEAMARAEQSGAAVVQLSELLQVRDFPVLPGEHEPLDVSEWSRDDYIRYGHWLVSITSDPERPRLRSQHVRRMHYLGLGPSLHQINGEFDNTFSGYKQALGIPVGYDRVKYADWGTADLVSYAAGLTPGRAPKHKDFVAAFERGEGPSYRMIERRGGGLRAINDLLGYPDTTQWEPDDFVSWGVRVMEANGGEDISLYTAAILSKRERGPSTYVIIDRFERWSEYKDRVLKEYARRQEAREERLRRYRGLVDNGQLPESAASLPEEGLLAAGGKFMVASCYARRLGQDKIREIAIKPGKTLITDLRIALPSLSASQIEIDAVALDVFDDIWPMQEHLKYLRVEPEELERQRARERSTKKLRRSVLRDASSASAPGGGSGRG